MELDYKNLKQLCLNLEEVAKKGIKQATFQYKQSDSQKYLLTKRKYLDLKALNDEILELIKHATNKNTPAPYKEFLDKEIRTKMDRLIKMYNQLSIQHSKPNHNTTM